MNRSEASSCQFALYSSSRDAPLTTQIGWADAGTGRLFSTDGLDNGREGVEIRHDQEAGKRTGLVADPLHLAQLLQVHLGADSDGVDLNILLAVQAMGNWSRLLSLVRLAVGEENEMLGAVLPHAILSCEDCVMGQLQCRAGRRDSLHTGPQLLSLEDAVADGRGVGVDLCGGAKVEDLLHGS